MERKLFCSNESDLQLTNLKNFIPLDLNDVTADAKENVAVLTLGTLNYQKVVYMPFSNYRQIMHCNTALYTTSHVSCIKLRSVTEFWCEIINKYVLPYFCVFFFTHLQYVDKDDRKTRKANVKVALVKKTCF